MFRPVSLSPFPYEQVEALADQVKGILVVEMNAGQMLEDVVRAVKGRVPVGFYGRMGGIMPFPDEVLSEIQRLVREPLSLNGDPRRRWLQRFEDVLEATKAHN